MKIAERTTICVIANVISLIPVFMFVGLMTEWEFGPSESLNIMNIPINTWWKYTVLVSLSSISRILEVIINDIGSPSLGFTIYDPTRTKVYGFGKIQLEILANTMYMFNSLGSIFRTIIMVSRLDIALISAFFGELGSFTVVHYLISKKIKFYPEFENEEEMEATNKYELVEVV